MKKLSILVKPNARSNSWGKDVQGNIWIRIAAPASEGKANKACIQFLSQILGVPKSKIELDKGKTGRIKQFIFSDDSDLGIFQ